MSSQEILPHAESNATIALVLEERLPKMNSGPTSYMMQSYIYTCMYVLFGQGSQEIYNMVYAFAPCNLRLHYNSTAFVRKTHRECIVS